MTLSQWGEGTGSGVGNRPYRTQYNIKKERENLKQLKKEMKKEKEEKEEQGCATFPIIMRWFPIQIV